MGDTIETENSTAVEESAKKSVSKWSFGSGEGSWQGRGRSVRSRTEHLYNNTEMSDLTLNASDENWWFGVTVKDFNAHKFLLASGSPVFHKILYDWDKEETDDGRRELVLDEKLQVKLSLIPGFDCQRLELEGVPPIAAEALLEYIYKDSFNEKDYEDGYSRNLLWRLWHASRALEMDHLHSRCVEIMHKTMCEETVFWDMNYSIKYKALGTEEIRTKVLKIMESLEEKLFEHPNFVWLEHSAVNEILDRREADSSEAMIIYNSLLRWSLYQLDRTACIETEDGRQGAEIPVTVRLEWIGECRNGKFDHVVEQDLDKYLSRGLERMPWTEMSQSDFLCYVVNARVISDQVTLPNAVAIMEIVVNNPDRLHRSSYSCKIKQRAPPPQAIQMKAAPAPVKTSKISELFSKDNIKIGQSSTVRG